MQLRTLWVHQGTALLALLLQGSLVLQKTVAAQIPNHEDEPPPDLVEKMSSWLSKQRCIDWNDLQAFGKLTDAQVDLLWYQRVNENLHADIPDLQKGREPLSTSRMESMGVAPARFPHSPTTPASEVACRPFHQWAYTRTANAFRIGRKYRCGCPCTSSKQR